MFYGVGDDVFREFGKTNGSILTKAYENVELSKLLPYLLMARRSLSTPAMFLTGFVSGLLFLPFIVIVKS